MSFEIIYETDEDQEIYWLFRNEAQTMREAGMRVSTEPSESATKLLRRCLIIDGENYPDDPRYLQNGKIYASYNLIDLWYPLIQDLTIETLFCEELGNGAAKAVKAHGWSRAFVKNAVKSLVEEDPLESVWPDVSFDVMREKFAMNPRKGPYALREYLPPETFEEERRYWVMGDRIHHSSGVIPDIVTEAALRLAKLGGVFYTIDATPELIVEINGGESSDRKTDNTAEDFASWIKQAFD